MKRAILSIAAALTAFTAAAQQSYSYQVTRTRTRTVHIDWRPEVPTHQRYTVSVSPLRLAMHGLKVNFERELPKPGHWFGTSLSVYMSPARSLDHGEWDNYGNNRSSPLSGFDDYHRMWGVGTSAMFRNTFSRCGWYFSTGITFDIFRVGVAANAYMPYTENGLTFYEYGRTLETKTYSKPTAQISIGKLFAISERCFFDLYAGLGLSYSFYLNDGRHTGYGYDYGSWGSSATGYSSRHPMFSDMGGFAYRGLTPVAGFRFGVLLWKN